MAITATRVTDLLVSRLAGITVANGYPFELVGVEPGKFYEDLPDGAPLPVATLVAATSGAVADQQRPVSGQRARQFQLEVVLDLDSYPGEPRHEVLDRVEWSICKAFGGPFAGRSLGGLALSLTVGDVEFNYPAPGHSIAVVRAQVAVSYIEQYQ
jgi:hypothetical protein